jgi:hypothetical protein
MKSEPSIIERLDAPTKAPYWPVAAEGNFYLNLGIIGRIPNFWLANLKLLYLKQQAIGHQRKFLFLFLFRGHIHRLMRCVCQLSFHIYTMNFTCLLIALSYASCR